MGIFLFFKCGNVVKTTKFKKKTTLFDV